MLDLLPLEVSSTIIGLCASPGPPRPGSVELCAVNRSMLSMVMRFKASVNAVADVLVDLHGPSQSLHYIYFTSPGSPAITARQIVEAGKSPELIGRLLEKPGARSFNDYAHGLLHDALMSGDTVGVQYVYTSGIGPFAPSWEIYTLPILRAAICNGPETFCIETLLPRCSCSHICRVIESWDIESWGIEDNPLAIALRNGRRAVVSYCIDRAGSTKSIRVRVMHALAVMVTGGSSVEFREALGCAVDDDYRDIIFITGMLERVVDTRTPSMPIIDSLLAFSSLQSGVCGVVHVVNAAIRRKHEDLVKKFLKLPQTDVVIGRVRVDFNPDADTLDILRILIEYEQESVLRMTSRVQAACPDLDHEVIGDMIRECGKLYFPEIDIDTQGCLLYVGCLDSLFDSAYNFAAALEVLGRSPGAFIVLLNLRHNRKAGDYMLYERLLKAASEDDAKVFETWFALPEVQRRTRSKGLHWPELQPVWSAALLCGSGAVVGVFVRNGYGLAPPVMAALTR